LVLIALLLTLTLQDHSERTPITATGVKAFAGAIFDRSLPADADVQLAPSNSRVNASETQFPRVLRVVGRTGGLLLIAFGLLPLYGAAQNYRKFRILKRTPQMPIRDLAKGFVHIRGKAVGEARRTSPITRLPCFFYEVKVEREVVAGKGSQWSMILLDSDRVNFYLQDATGKVRIDLHRAQLDLYETFRERTGPRPVFQRNVDPNSPGAPSESELLDYLYGTNAQIRGRLALAARHGEGSVSLLPAELSARDREGLVRSSLMFTERCLLPDREYSILGTCVENPNSTDAHDRYMIVRGQQDRTFVISGKPEPVIENENKTGVAFLVGIGSVLILIGLAFLSVFSQVLGSIP